MSVRVLDHAWAWPQYAAAILPAGAGIAVVNRGFQGTASVSMHHSRRNRGAAGLSRFDVDVLETAGITHLVIANNSNDWGLPGRVTPMDEMPPIAQLIDGYQELISPDSRSSGDPRHCYAPRARAPRQFGPESIRLALNAWIRTSGHEVVDFDAAICSEVDPSRLEAVYAPPDDTHPHINGEKRLAQAMVQVIARMKI